MYRASTNADDPFFAVVQTSASSIVLEYRTTTGGSISIQSVTGIPVGAEYVEIIRNGSNFSGYYSSNGSSWTQLGSTVAIAAMPATAEVGIAASANFNSQLTSATFANVNVSTVVAPAVSAFQVNDGSVQRAMVTSLTVTFNEPVTLSAGAITLNLLSQTGGASTPMSFTLTPSSGSSTSFVLTFTDPSYIGGSLPDGAYELSVAANGVTSGGLNMAASQNFTFTRLYGDFEGTGAVTGEDFTQLVTLLGKATNPSDSYVDFDGDGVISGSDFTQFVTRLGTSISVPALPSVVLLAAAPPVTNLSSTSTTLTPPTTSETKVTTASAVAPAVATQPIGKKKARHGHGR
jgi:hypothetical protein